MSHRMERVNVLLRQEISRVLSEEVNDPRLFRLLSITRVDTTADLAIARVFVSVLGSPDEKSSTMAALHSASGFVRRSLRHRVTFKSLPAVSFVLDESIEQGAEVLKLIDESAPSPESDGSKEP